MAALWSEKGDSRKKKGERWRREVDGELPMIWVSMPRRKLRDDIGALKSDSKYFHVFPFPVLRSLYSYTVLFVVTAFPISGTCSIC